MTVPRAAPLFGLIAAGHTNHRTVLSRREMMKATQQLLHEMGQSLLARQ